MSTEPESWDNPNQSAGMVACLNYLAMGSIGVWALGILWFLIAATRLPPVY